MWTHNIAYAMKVIQHNWQTYKGGGLKPPPPPIGHVQNQYKPIFDYKKFIWQSSASPILIMISFNEI